MTLNRPFDSGSELKYPCPKCGKPMLLLPHSFRPPKKTDEKAWQLVNYLIQNGFRYQHIYQEGSDEYHGKITDNYISYPKNLRDAKEFVQKYKPQLKK